MIRLTRLGFSISRVRMLAAVELAPAAAATVNLSHRRKASSSSSSFPSFPDLASFPKRDDYEFVKKVKTILRERNGPVDDAIVDQTLDFIMEAKDVFDFEDKPEKFLEFLTLLIDFRYEKIKLKVLKEGMMKLFEGHNDLISRFNVIFLPGEVPLPLHDE